MNKHHIDVIINEMLEDVRYIKRDAFLKNLK